MSETPREMTRADVRQAIDDYRDAAGVASDAGFDGVQLQAGYFYLIQQFLHETTNRRTDQYGGTLEKRARFLFDVLEAIFEVWPSQRVGVKTGPMMNEVGAFRAVPSTVPMSEYVYERLNAYKLSHVFLMRQLADLSNTPISAFAGDGVVHHFRRLYQGTLILNVGIDPKHGAELLRDGLGDLIAFGRDYIANPDLVERIRLDAPLNDQRPEGYYGSSPVGYTDYPFMVARFRRRASMERTMSSTKTASNTTAATQFLQVKDHSYAYRRFGNGSGLPLLCLQHFTGTLDNWDPAVTDPLASGRELILFDNAGVGRSTGEVPQTVAGMAGHAKAFLDALGIETCDVLGYSLGGMVALQMVQDRPSIFRRMILVGTAPRGGEDIMHLEKPSSGQAHPGSREQRIRRPEKDLLHIVARESGPG